jgi:hypothetical protein
MKVKTFTGTHRATVDRQVNNWLAKSNVTVLKTNVAFKAMREWGPDAIAGKTAARRALAIAISLVRRAVPSKAKTKFDQLGFQIQPIASEKLRCHCLATLSANGARLSLAAG